MPTFSDCTSDLMGRPTPAVVLWQVPGEPSRLADIRSPGRRVREEPVTDPHPYADEED